MSDLWQCSRKFLKEFIDLYKSFPCLMFMDYSNKHKTNLAYEELVKKFKEVDLWQTKRQFVRIKKINSMRTVYKKQLAKVKQSATSGVG